MSTSVNRLAMRAGWLMALCLLGGFAVAQHEHHAMQPHRVSTNAKIAVQDDAQVQVLTVRVGPLELPAHTDHHVAAQAPDLFLTIPFDGWLVAYHPRLVDDAGKTLPNKLLHHVAFYNTARADFLCPKKLEHIFGAGGEMNDWPANPGVGYRVARGDRILVGTMFHNPYDEGYPKTYLEVKMEYQRYSPDGPELKNVYPTWFDVRECGDSGYDLKPGQNVNTGEFQLSYAGILVGVGGHLHDYGRSLQLEDVTRKDPIATLNSKLDPQQHILSMPIVNFADRGGYRLNQGEVVKVTATYDNPTGRNLVEGAMGIVVGYFLPDDDHALASLRRTQDNH